MVMTKISRVMAIMINLCLKPLGVKLTKMRTQQTGTPDVVKLSKYKQLIQEFHGWFSESIFPDLPSTENRCELLEELMGTGLSEAMYILAFLHRSMKLEGDVCEFGVAQGTTSALLANEILTSDKHLWLFDSFEGLPKPSAKDKLNDDIFDLGSIEAYQGTMRCSIDEVRSRMSAIQFPSSRLQIIPGFIEETRKNARLPDKLCFAYVDFDFYEPTSIALTFLSEHLSVGGSVIIDDYGFFSSGVKTAVDEFMATHSDSFEMIIPPKYAGHCVILVKKPKMT